MKSEDKGERYRFSITISAASLRAPRFCESNTVKKSRFQHREDCLKLKKE